MKKSTIKNAKTKNWNYEATVNHLEKIIDEIESGQLELAEVFEKAWAVAALQECEQFLTEKKKQMNLLIETLEDDEPEF